MAGTSCGEHVTTVRHARETRDKEARKKQNEYGGARLFRARLLLSYFKRSLRKSETVSTSTTPVKSLCSRQIVSGVQCSSFKGKISIDGDGDWERKDSQNGFESGEPTHYHKLSRLIVLATFYGLYFVCSMATLTTTHR